MCECDTTSECFERRRENFNSIEAFSNKFGLGIKMIDQRLHISFLNIQIYKYRNECITNSKSNLLFFKIRFMETFNAGIALSSECIAYVCVRVYVWRRTMAPSDIKIVI